MIYVVASSEYCVPRNFTDTSLKVLASAPPSMIPMSGGFPNPDMFPFSHLSLTIPGHSNMG